MGYRPENVHVQAFRGTTTIGASSRVVVARNLLLEAELSRILRAFNEARLELIVLKGVPLMHRVYRTMSTRATGDNDILVRRTDVIRAVALLTGLGYVGRRLPTLTTALRTNFQYPLHRQHLGTETVVDLHWHAFEPRLHPVHEHILWENLEQVRVGALEVPVFNKELTLVHLAAHFAQHQFRELGILRDFVFAWRRWHGELDVIKLIQLAEVTDLSPSVEYALDAAAEHFELEVELPELRTRRAAIVRRLMAPKRLFGQSGSTARSSQALCLLLARPSRALHHALHVTFPPVESMSQIYDEPVSPKLMLKYATRPFRPIARMLGYRSRSPRGTWE